MCKIAVVAFRVCTSELYLPKQTFNQVLRSGEYRVPAARRKPEFDTRQLPFLYLGYAIMSDKGVDYKRGIQKAVMVEPVV